MESNDMRVTKRNNVLEEIAFSNYNFYIYTIL